MRLIWLLAAHHFADVALQPDWLIKLKSKRLFAIFEHVMVYTGVVCATLYWLGDTVTPWIFAYFAVGHWLTDAFFYQFLPWKTGKPKPYWHVYPDQALHYLQIVLYLVLMA